ncbi:MAG: dipeptidase [Thermoplasmata archaeon]
MNIDNWKTLHFSSTIVDLHTDVIVKLFGERNAFGERIKYRLLGEKSTIGQLDIPRMIEGGINCQIFAIWSGPKYQYNKMLRAFELLDHLLNEISLNNLNIGLATSYNNIVQINKNHKIAAVLSLEGGEPLDGEISMLRNFYRLGVRMIGLTWNFQNELGFGAYEKSNYGLTEFGFKVVEEANSLGMVIDVSHLNKAGFYDVIETSSKPIIASHSNVKSICSNKRNLNDKQIKLIADKGGLIGINFIPEFLARKDSKIDDIIKHIDYVSKLVGFEYVGLGSDFEGGGGVKGLEDVSKLPLLTKKLIEKGFNETAIKKVMGENALNVFKEVLK